MKIIDVQNVSKSFKVAQVESGFKGMVRHLFNPQYTVKTAVQDLAFSINEGEKVAYIGPNGAGKSTTIKLLTGILVPDAGNVYVNNVIPYKNRIVNAKNIGALFGQRTQLWWDLPTREAYELLKRLYKISDETYEKNRRIFNDILDLHTFWTTPVRKLSLGQRLRSDLGACFLHDPKIVFLDEPTIGLDILVKDKVRQFINEINQTANTTIILTSHDLRDIDEICDRVIVIDQGKVIQDTTLDQLKMLYNHHQQIEIIFKNAFSQANLESCDYYTVDLVKGNKCKVTYDKTKVSFTQMVSELAKRYEILDVKVSEPEIETVIKKLYGDFLTESRAIAGGAK